MRCKECLSGVVAIMIVLLLVDLSCGPEISPWVAYAVPVALASRYSSFSMGAAYSVIGALLLLVAARLSTLERILRFERLSREAP
jgi:hypothetical protein